MNNKDESITNLINESQISKDDIRFEAIGSVDEATAALGFAKANSTNHSVKQDITIIQTHLYMLMAVLAGQSSDINPTLTFDQSKLDWLQDLVARYQKLIILPKGFIYPGDSVPSGAMALARTTVRRAERRLVTLKNSQFGIEPVLINFLNRLSYLCYLLELVEIQKVNIVE